jgi:hypothetical protein
MIRKYLARDHKFYQSEDDGATFIEISGINEWGFEIDSSEEDVSTFDNGAWGSNIYTQRTGSLSLTGFYLVDGTTGARDTGQLNFERASMQVGYAAYRTYRVAMVNASGVRLGYFDFVGQPSVESFGGSVTDVAPWGGNVLFDGRPTGSGVYNIFS